MGKQNKRLVGIFMDISEYLGMFRNYSGIFKTLSNIYNRALQSLQLLLFLQIKIIFVILFSHSLLFLTKVYFSLHRYLYNLKKCTGPGGQGLRILIYPSYVVIFFLQQINKVYLKAIQKKQGVSKNMSCCHFLLVIVIAIILICKRFFKNTKISMMFLRIDLVKILIFCLFPKVV